MTLTLQAPDGHVRKVRAWEGIEILNSFIQYCFLDNKFTCLAVLKKMSRIILIYKQILEF